MSRLLTWYEDKGWQIMFRYGMDAEDAPPPPDLPDWCFEEEVKVILQVNIPSPSLS